ncbi:hydrolase [Shimazuella sp. AN120528]|uniref:hydrolase n=1 Tax=Shimazuella soli TaxID=1892854 RepID=UPI001F0D76D3|nr:hydrolase [Shimazuella soli]MCH5585392.1 hydrolase [Shimazuella soli]
MKKQTYYVTVDGTIHSEQLLDDAPYDFEIQATDQEIKDLQDLFQQTYNKEWDTFVQSHMPFQTEDRQKASTDVDENVREIYSTIYQLGTEETKKSIESLGLLDLS